MSNVLHYTFRAGANINAPLAYLIHGRAGNVSVMSTFARSLPEDWALVFVQAPLADPIGGFSWWDVQSLEKKTEQIDSSLAQLTSFVINFTSTKQITPQFVVAIGFSQGAAMVSLLTQLHPEIFKAIVLLSGLVIPRKTTAITRPQVLVIHGELDQVVTLDKVLLGIDHLRTQGFNVTLHTESVGHKVGIQGMRLLKEWAIAL